MVSFTDKRLQKGCFAAVIFAALVFAPVGVNAYAQTEEMVIIEESGSAPQSPEVKEDHIPLALQEPDVFQSDYGESAVARKMTKAEKAKNAAENDSWGGAITIIAMCIVLSALVVLSILFMIFGKVSESILTAKKKAAKAKASHAPHDDTGLAPGEVIAAISLALSEYFGDKHDIEDTHLTIRRLQKSYSPWNSKIYNLRPNLEHRRNNLTDN